MPTAATIAPKPFGSADDMPPELKEVLRKVRDRKELAEKFHRPYVDRWNYYYGLYRNFRKLRTSFKDAQSAKEKGLIVIEAQREWGAELFVPYTFATIETIVPRVLSNDPKMLVRPRNPQAREAALRVQELINAQQTEINYELKLQPTARRGLKYGLGVQKTFWERKRRKVTRVAPSLTGPGQQAIQQEITLREGPQAEDVDIWDFFWDPAAKNMETAQYVIHRTWRSIEYIKRQVESGAWFPVDLEKVKRMASDTARGDIWKDRMEAAGLKDFDTRHGALHEVLEYHDGENVHTVLDNQLVVQNAKTPFFHREMPFQIYRPTLQEGEFVGVGEIEPMAHLQAELNTMRGQRRDNATLVLQKPVFYAEGMMDPDDFVIGPGVAIPTLGRPQDAIFPFDIGDIPASSYREEDALKADIELTSGISEAIAGSGSGQATAGTETATGIQLIQQAAGVRIALKTKNLERELIKPAARQWLELNRQFVVNPKDVRVEDPDVEEGFRFEQVGPDELFAEIEDPLPDSGSTEPENFIVRQQKAVQLYNQLSTNPAVDPRRLATYLMEQHDILNAESFLIPDTPQLDPSLMGDFLQQLGVDDDVILQATEATLQAMQEEEEAEKSGQQPPSPPDDA